MKQFLFYSLLFSLFACKEKKAPVTDPALAAQTPLPAHDSVSSKDSNRVNPTVYKTVYIEKGALTTKKYIITVSSMYEVPDSMRHDSNYYFKDNFVFVHDKTSNRTDTLKLETDNEELSELSIQDLTDSLHFKSLFFSIGYQGDSDAMWDVYIGYSNKSLRTFFSTPGIQTMYRKDDWTLAGFMSDRDELVTTSEFDYPYTISLKDWDIDEKIPDKQFIGYSSIALATIKGYRMFNKHDSSAYTIKKGTELSVDSLYRSANIARLIIGDSIVIHVNLEKAKGKLKSNDAG